MILNENNENKFNEDFNQIKKETILNEQYYGSNKYTDALDALFQEALDLTKTEREATKLTTIGIGANIHTKKISNIEQRISNLIKEWFNFKEVLFVFEPFTGINACTACVVFRESFFAMDPKYNKIVNKYGIRYEKPQRHVSIRFATEFLTMSGITNKMLTGVLLHEIGHNFYEEVTVTKSITEFMFMVGILEDIGRIVGEISKGIDTNAPLQFYNLINDLSYLLSTLGFVGTAYTKFMNIVLKSPLNVFFKFTKFSVGIFNSITQTYKQLRFYFNLPLQFKITPHKIMRNAKDSLGNLTLFRHQFRDELFADNFATAYGYGDHVIQLQRLFINGDYNFAASLINHFKLLALYKDLIDLPDALFLGFNDVHPDNVARMIDQISYVEDNLKLETNKDKRKAMSKDLENMKNSYKKFQNDLKLNGDIPRRGKLLTALLLKIDDENKGKVAYKIDKFTNKQRIDGVWKALI